MPIDRDAFRAKFGPLYVSAALGDDAAREEASRLIDELMDNDRLQPEDEDEIDQLVAFLIPPVDDSEIFDDSDDDA